MIDLVDVCHCPGQIDCILPLCLGADVAENTIVQCGKIVGGYNPSQQMQGCFYKK